MIVAIHQPHYLPWLRYMHKVAACDVFVLLDDTQYEKNGWQNRNQIKGPNGLVLLTVPVKDASFKPINEVRINPQTPWAEKHWKSIQHCCGKAPFFRKYAGVFEAGFAHPWTHLADLNRHFLGELVRALDISTRIVSTSSLGVNGRGTQRLIDICRRLGATQYLTGAFAAGNHLETDMFADNGIRLLVQDWVCPIYRQQFPLKGFVPELSAIDLLFNEGPSSLNILMDGRSTGSYLNGAPVPAVHMSFK